MRFEKAKAGDRVNELISRKTEAMTTLLVP